MSLPCAHLVQKRLQADDRLQPTDFHHQWYLDRLATLPPIDPYLLLRDPVKVRAKGRDDDKRGQRELSQFKHARRATIVLSEKTIPKPPTSSAWDYTKVARPRVYARTVEDVIQHLPKLLHGSSFQCVKPDEVTENKGL
jgi:hypothetical protein